MTTIARLIVLGLLSVPFGVGGAEPERACIDCHESGKAPGHPPRISGQRAAYLEQALRDYATAHRSAFPMEAVAASLDAPQRATLARALSARPWKPARAGAGATAARGAERIAALDCRRCHGSNFTGRGAVPRLAGQDPVYLERRLRGFGDEPHPPERPNAKRYGFDATLAAELAAHLARLDGRPTPTR